MPGVICALHKGREKGDFVIARRVTGYEYPVVDIPKEMKEYLKQDAYTHVWWQEISIPKTEA